MNIQQPEQARRVDLVIATGCVHCTSLMEIFNTLIKNGDIAQLNIRNLSVLPDVADTLKIRSVPWTKIGPFEFTGAMNRAEIMGWVEKLQSDQGMQDYLTHLLSNGELDHVFKLLNKQRDLLRLLPVIMQQENTPMGAKIGIGAVFEQFQGSRELQALIPRLGELTIKENDTTRIDACYYLGLTHSQEALAYLHPLLSDSNLELRETAAEAVTMLQQNRGQ